MAANALDELPAVIARAENLPTVPGVALEVLRLSRDENAGIEDFADAISRDPALAAKLLRISNSSLFSMTQEVTTLTQATMVLGLKTVQLMSLSFSLVSALPREGGLGRFRFSEYWRRSLVASVAGRSFCRLLNGRLGDEAYMAGLLSHIGQLVLVQCMPDDYGRVLDACEGWPDRSTELRVLGFDHAAVGETLLTTWGLPKIICTTVGEMHQEEEVRRDLDASTSELVWIMRMASLSVSVLCDDEKARALTRLFEVGSLRRLSEERISSFLVGLESGIRETADLLELDLDLAGDHASIIEEARSQVMSISLGVAAEYNHVSARASALESQNRELAERASTDRLTGIANRAGFDMVVDKEIGARIEGRVPNALGLLLIDIDHFKRFNDTHGHRAGDRVLSLVGGILKRLTRQSDVPARYGGEEFAVVVPQTTPFALRGYAERIRRTIEAVTLPLADGTEVAVTVSIGGACLVRASDPAQSGELIERADKNLYTAKSAGRNRVEVTNELLSFA